MMLDHVSYSQLKTFGQCPRKWHYEKVSDVKPEMPLRDNVGWLFHIWAEEYGAHCREAGLRSDLDFARQMAAICEHPELSKLMVKFSETYQYEPATHRGRGEAEIAREVELGDGLPKFVCRVDDLRFHQDDMLLKVIDFKTPWGFPHTDEPPWQLQLYGWVAQLTEGEFLGLPENEFLAVDLIVWIVPLGEAYTWPVEDNLDRTVRPQVVTATRRLMAAIEADEWPARPQQAVCQYCTYLHDCEPANRMEMTMPATVEDAVELWGSMTLAGQAKTRGLSHVKAFEEEHGPIPYGDGQAIGWHLPVWARKGKVRATAIEDGSEELFDALNEAGDDPWDYLNWDEARLGKRFHDALSSSESPFGAEETDEDIIPFLDPVEPGRQFGLHEAEDDS